MNKLVLNPDMKDDTSSGDFTQIKEKCCMQPPKKCLKFKKLCTMNGLAFNEENKNKSAKDLLQAKENCCLAKQTEDER